MKSNYIKNIVLISALLFVNVNAQNKIKTSQNSDIIEYRSKDGLPSNNFTSAAQTKDGYIWLSGPEGTFRFDGYEFAYIGKELGIPEMQAVFYDSSKDMLYFASPEKFASFDGSKFTAYDHSSGYALKDNPGQVISFVKKDSKGTIWIGSYTPFVDRSFNGSLINFRNNKFTTFDSLSFPLHNASNFLETPFGDLIFTSFGRNTQNGDGAYIALYKNDRFTKIDSAYGFNYYNAIIEDEYSSYIDLNGNTYIPFSGNLDLENENTNKGSGVLIYDGENFKSLPGLENKIAKGNYVGSVFCDNENKKVYANIYRFAAEKISKSDNTIFEINNNKWDPSEILKEIYLNAGNDAFKLLNFSYNFSRFQKSSNQFPFSLIFGSVGISQSSSDVTQFFTVKNNKWEKYDAFIGNTIINLNNGVLLATAKGIGFYSKNNSILLTKKDGLLYPETTIPQLYTDKNGLVWIINSYSDIPTYISLSSVGINVWDGNKLRTITIKDGLKSNITFEPLQDSNMRIWIPTDKGITQIREIRNSDGEWIFKLKNYNLKSGEDYNVSTVLETEKKELYVYQNYVRPQYSSVPNADFFLGKIVDNNIEEIKSPFSKELQSLPYQLFSLRAAKNGHLWLAGHFANNIEKLSSVKTELKIFDGTNWIDPPKDWNVPNQKLHFVGELDNGAFYLTAGHFYNFNGREFIELSDSIDQFANYSILKGASVSGTQTNIQVGNYLYIRLRNRGLAIFDGKNLNYYTPRNSIIPTDIHNPEINFNGDVFFGSHSGAVKIRGEKVELYYDDETITVGGPASAAVDMYGNIVKFFTGIGLSIEKYKKESAVLKISSVSINDKSYYYQYPNTLSYSDNSLLFNYAVLNFSHPDQTMYEHILEGYDKEWSRQSNLSFSEYQNLPPGNYVFKVRATVANGEKINESTYAFVIHPPYWKTWWAYSTYLLILGGFLYTVRKIELKRQEKNAAIQESKLRAEAAELQAKAAEAQSRVVQAENERKSNELEEARQLQLSMLPKELPFVKDLDIAVYMKTATEVGGDYYDFALSADGTLNVAVGDGTGHGMQAGTLVTLIKGLFTSEVCSKQILNFFNDASRTIKEINLGRLMMAFSLLKIKEGHVQFSSAGMPPLYIYRSSSKMVEEINLEGMPLGAMKKFNYKLYETQIESGDILLLMSDGYPELSNDNKEQISYERVKIQIAETAERSSSEIIEYFKKSGSDWVNDKNPDDDVTFVVLKVK